MSDQPQPPNAATPMDPKQRDELILHLRILEDLINNMLRLRVLAISVVVLVLLLGAGFVGATLWIQRTARDLKSDTESVRDESREVKQAMQRLEDLQDSLRGNVLSQYGQIQANSRDLVRIMGQMDQIRTDAAERELRQFQGKWTPAKLIDAEGNPFADMNKYKLTVSGEQSTLENAGGKADGFYRLNPLRRPREIDIVVTSGPDKEKTYLGVYEFVGEELRIAHDPKGERRPDRVEPGKGYVYEEWKKAK